MDQFATKASGGPKVSENENPDHLELMRLLQEAKPLTEPQFADQQKKWAAESPLPQEISAILVNHPEYYDEIRAHIGIATLPDTSLLAAHLARPILQIDEPRKFLAPLPIETLAIA